MGDNSEPPKGRRAANVPMICGVPVSRQQRKKDEVSWLQEAMSRAGFDSLDQLSQACGINKGTLSRYFRGIQSPSVQVIPPLCTALGVSPEELLRGLGVIE
jgi:transcriptional regulator with XRE-family HTH domain